MRKQLDIRNERSEVTDLRFPCVFAREAKRSAADTNTIQ